MTHGPAAGYYGHLAAFAVKKGRHDAYFTLAGCDDTDSIGADELDALFIGHGLYAHNIMYGNVLGDDYQKRYAGLDSLDGSGLGRKGGAG